MVFYDFIIHRRAAKRFAKGMVLASSCQSQQELASFGANPFDSSRVVGLIRQASPAKSNT
jgi:hypothetical protein